MAKTREDVSHMLIIRGGRRDPMRRTEAGRNGIGWTDFLSPNELPLRGMSLVVEFRSGMEFSRVLGETFFGWFLMRWI
jgi:hypothetical protein